MASQGKSAQAAEKIRRRNPLSPPPCGEDRPGAHDVAVRASRPIGPHLRHSWVPRRSRAQHKRHRRRRLRLLREGGTNGRSREAGAPGRTATESCAARSRRRAAAIFYSATTTSGCTTRSSSVFAHAAGFSSRCGRMPRARRASGKSHAARERGLRGERCGRRAGASLCSVLGRSYRVPQLSRGIRAC